MAKRYKNPWKTLSSKYVYKNPWFRVREDAVIHPNGNKGIYGVIEKDRVVYIVAINDKNEICLVGQHRYTVDKFSWEIPAGACDGQAPLTAAKRELWEETGFKAKKWKKIGVNYVAMGIASIEAHIFLAEGLIQSGQNKMDEDGVTGIKMVTLRQLMKEMKDGKMFDTESAAMVLYYLAFIGKKY